MFELLYHHGMMQILFSISSSSSFSFLIINSVHQSNGFFPNFFSLHFSATSSFTYSFIMLCLHSLISQYNNIHVTAILRRNIFDHNFGGDCKNKKGHIVSKMISYTHYKHGLVILKYKSTAGDVH